MYQVWLYCGEFIVLGIWGMVLALARRILFGGLCREAALENGGKGRMLKAMTLKFEKSFEVRVGISDIPVFVQKYLYLEKKFGIPLVQWRRLPERWTGLILGIGLAESMLLRYLGYDGTFCLNRMLAAAAAAAAVWSASLLFESDSLWEQAGICLLDYVSNTLYPRQNHVYEGFIGDQNPEKDVGAAAKPVLSEIRTEEKTGEKQTGKGIVLQKEEEKIFQEVLSDFLGSST